MPNGRADCGYDAQAAQLGVLWVPFAIAFATATIRVLRVNGFMRNPASPLRCSSSSGVLAREAR
jgi:hypothetical protein